MAVLLLIIHLCYYYIGISILECTKSWIVWFGRYEEYIDYVFPEENQATNLKILEAAYKWKKQKISSDED